MQSDTRMMLEMCQTWRAVTDGRQRNETCIKGG